MLCSIPPWNRFRNKTRYPSLNGVRPSVCEAPGRGTPHYPCAAWFSGCNAIKLHLRHHWWGMIGSTSFATGKGQWKARMVGMIKCFIVLLFKEMNVYFYSIENSVPQNNCGHSLRYRAAPLCMLPLLVAVLFTLFMLKCFSHLPIRLPSLFTVVVAVKSAQLKLKIFWQCTVLATPVVFAIYVLVVWCL